MLISHHFHDCKAPLARASHVKWRYTKYLVLTFNLLTFTVYVITQKILDQSALILLWAVSGLIQHFASGFCGSIRSVAARIQALLLFTDIVFNITETICSSWIYILSLHSFSYVRRTRDIVGSDVKCFGLCQVDAQVWNKYRG